jgi:hypothetical protein
MPTQPFVGPFVGILDKDRQLKNVPIVLTTAYPTPIDVSDLEVSVVVPTHASGDVNATITGSLVGPIVRLQYPQFDDVWDNAGIASLAKPGSVVTGYASWDNYDLGQCIEGVGTCSGDVAARLDIYDKPISTKPPPKIVTVKGIVFTVELTITLPKATIGQPVRGYVALRM